MNRDINEILEDLENYKEANGSYPPWSGNFVESLSGNGEGPRDFWSMPFFYNEKDGVVTVYSFGPNGTDDHGPEG
ncbi:hypothetical protein N9850_04090 [Granulosicoccus sp.]|nr:hypothetical protein [Granulosicoccus sp.]MDB4222929.1 hypothetical protein [Granulosicoccus sp.]